MKVTVKIKPNAVKTITEAQYKAAGLVAEQMRHEIITAQVIPFDTGNLQNVTTYTDLGEAKKGKISIHHDAPYAQRLYYHPEYNFQTTFNVNARGLWWEEWLEGSLRKRPMQLYKEFYRRLAGGYVK